MPGASFRTDIKGLRENLQRQFIGNTTWPPDRASLTALIDLGLSDERIADYFHVSRPDVVSLRRAYHIMHLRPTLY